MSPKVGGSTERNRVEHHEHQQDVPSAPPRRKRAAGGDHEVTADLLESLGLAAHKDALDEVVRVRLDDELLARLDRVEAFMRGRRIRQVNRSSLIRAAISSYLDGIEEAIPDLKGPETR